MSHPTARTLKFARPLSREDNASSSRPGGDPRRALVRLLAELIVEDHLAEQAQSVTKEKIREEE